MKMKLLMLAALLLLVTPAFADYAWHVIVNDAGQPAFYSIAGTSDTVLHACGTEGVVSKSTDRGVTWTSSTIGSNQYTWYAVTFPSANTGYIAGTRRDLTRAVLYKTIDGGATWNLNIDTGVTDIFYDCYFVNENTGWAVGRNNTSPPVRVYRTVNGGTSWVGEVPPASLPWAPNAFGLHAVPTGIGGGYFVWVVGNGGNMARSKDSGESYTAVASGTSSGLVGVFFIDKDNGWVVGANGTIIKTTNGSADTPTWTAQTSGTTQILNQVYFADANNGWVTGTNGTILTTTNGGTTWTAATTGTTASLSGIYYYDSNDIWVVGEGSRVAVKYGGVFLNSLSQGSLRRGETASITATVSNLNTGATVAFSGSGITVSNIQVVSSTQITFTAKADDLAAAGPYDIKFNNNDGTITTFSGYFAVVPDTGNIPIDTVVPGYGYQNTTQKFMISGTGFNNTARVIISGSGVTATVDTAKLTSTSIPVTLAIGANATTGLRDVMVTQGNDIGYKANAFEVKAASSTGQTIKNVVFGPNPLTRNAGNVINVQFEDTSTGVIEMPIFDMTGRPIAKLSHNTTSPGLQKHAINVITDPIVAGSLANGAYKMLFIRGGIQNSGKIFLAR